MASTCISDCINDLRVPIQPAYMHRYRWPESDAEFVRSLSSNTRRGSHAHHPQVVDSRSCRQMFLRSYTFSREETVNEKTIKCFGRVKERVKSRRGKQGQKSNFAFHRKRVVLRRAKEASCAALLSIFRRLLSCTSNVDVADRS